MKRIITAMLIALSALGITMQYAHGISIDLRDSVYRLHVIANSDSEADQALKLKVRDRVIKELDTLVGSDASLKQTKKAAENNLKQLCLAATDEVEKNGYDYPVTVRTGSFHFPTKTYGDVALPQGKYDGLQVVIGSGQGQNWWCVLYPNLCFVDGVVSMPEDSKAKLGEGLSKEELEMINAPDGKVKLKFKLLEIFD